jgi:hypothetical protein
MKSGLSIFMTLLMIITLNSCRQKEKASDMNIIYLHHSIGEVIWRGTPSLLSRIVRRINKDLSYRFHKVEPLPLLFEKYNKTNNKNYRINEMYFPKASPYGWNNNPYDYYNIWVKNAGNRPFMDEPTLEMLTKEYQLIIFKHCTPVFNINPDLDSADINSDYKSLSNYKLQYLALRDKFHEFPSIKFILFTGAAQGQNSDMDEEAKRAKEFFEWVTNEWDLPGDNIYLWDFYGLQTEGDLYFKSNYAVSEKDSHPNAYFAGRVVKLLFNRIIDVIENNGNKTRLTGEIK